MPWHTPKQEELGPIFFRDNLLENLGDEVPPHDHDFDHVTLVIRGRISIRLEDTAGNVTVRNLGQGERENVPANWQHSFVALEPDTLAVCIYPRRPVEGDPRQIYR